MSQMGSFFIPGVFPPGSVVQTLSGNAGVNPVSPDGLNTINVFGDTVTTNVTGDGVNTLTVSVTDNFASTYTTDDANFAVPVAYNLNVFGVDGIATTSAGDTVTIGTDGTLPDTFNADVGSAVPALGIIAFVGAGGITTSAAGSTVTIDGSGIVGGITSITGDTGGAQAGPGITFAGGTTGLAFGGAANTLTTTFAGITANGGVVNLGSDAANNAINIGTASAAGRTITLGNTTGTTDLDLRYGTGDFTLASATGTVMSALDTGEITYPLQSAFLAVGGAQIDVTGDGTVYTITFTTEIFDQNSDFDGTSTFTAPVTGRYQLNFNVRIQGILMTHTTTSYVLVTSNRSYSGFVYQPFNVGESFSGSVASSFGNTVLADMDSADTAIVQISVSGGTKVVDLATTSNNIRFSGYLAC